MRDEAYIVGFDDGSGFMGPFKVFTDRKAADKFVRLCREGGDQRRCVVGAEWLDKPKPETRWGLSSTVAFTGYSSMQYAAALNDPYAGLYGAQRSNSQQSLLNSFGNIWGYRQ